MSKMRKNVDFSEAMKARLEVLKERSESTTDKETMKWALRVADEATQHGRGIYEEDQEHRPVRRVLV